MENLRGLGGGKGQYRVEGKESLGVGKHQRSKVIVVKTFRELFRAEDIHPLTYFLGRRSTSITATTNADISPYQKNR